MPEATPFDGPLEWDSSETLTRQRKTQIARELRARDASPGLSEPSRRALVEFEEPDLGVGLLAAVLRHEGHEDSSDETPSYPYEHLVATYRELLLRSSRSQARQVMHFAVSGFTPGGKGRVGEPIAGALEGQLVHTVDDHELCCLADILMNRCDRPPKALAETLCSRLEAQPPTDHTQFVGLLAKACGILSERKSADGRQVKVRAGTIFVQILQQRRTLESLQAVLTAITYGGDDWSSVVPDEPLIDLLVHPKPEVRNAAMTTLARRGLSKEICRKMLRTDPSVDVLATAIKLLGDNGCEPREIIEDSAAHPLPTEAAQALLKTMNDRQWGALSQAWPALPAPFRTALSGLDSGTQGNFFDHSLLRNHRHWMLDDLFHFRNSSGDSATACLALGALLRPLHERLAVYDLESVSGLRRVREVYFGEVPLLRFQFLAERNTRRGRPIRDVIRSLQHDAARLVELEIQYDLDRDRVARVQASVQDGARRISLDLWAQLSRLLERHSRDSDYPAQELVRRVSKEFNAEAGRWAETALQLATEQRRLATTADSGMFAPLLHATQVLTPILLQEGVELQPLTAPDGVLGEYRAIDPLFRM